MSPRPAANRHDSSAIVFLDAAASLLDASLSPATARLPRRLASFRFPAALDWLRVEDVLHQVAGVPGGSGQAFHHRWETKDAFLRDALVYTIQYQDRPKPSRSAQLAELAADPSPDFGDRLAAASRDYLRMVETDPRAFLMSHVGAMLGRYPALHYAYLDAWLTARPPPEETFRAILARRGLTLRPEWTIERFDRALQAVVDGFLLHGRLQPDSCQADAWTHADLFAETVVAFTIGTLDLDHDGRTARRVLNGGEATRRALLAGRA